MLTFENTITVYTTMYNPDTGFDDYFRTVIIGVSWYSQIKAAAGASGLVYGRLFKVRIPEKAKSKKSYVPPEEYTDPATLYTLKPGTIILKGEGPPAPTNAKETVALTTAHTEAFKVMDFHDNRRIGLKHLYVEGK